MSMFDEDYEVPEVPEVPDTALKRVLNVSGKNFRVSGELLAPGATGWATDADLKRAQRFGKVLKDISPADG